MDWLPYLQRSKTGTTWSPLVSSKTSSLIPATLMPKLWRISRYGGHKPAP